MDTITSVQLYLKFNTAIRFAFFSETPFSHHLKKFLDTADICLVPTACYIYVPCLCEALMLVGITEIRKETNQSVNADCEKKNVKMKGFNKRLKGGT